MGNRPSYAIASALIAAAGVQAQDSCSCSPTRFEFVLTLNQTCDTNDLNSTIDRGIINPQCLTAELDDLPPSANEGTVRRHLQDDPITNVTRITFLEFDSDGEKMAISNEYECTAGDSCYDGTVFKFDSVSSRLNTSLPLADQTALVPGGASLIIYGETESGKIMRNRIWWSYQLENCGRDTNPVQVDDKVGWVTVRDVASAWPVFCKRALGNPTIAPAEYEPTTTPSTPAPIDTANPQPPNPTPTGSTPAPTETNPLLPTYPTLSPKPTLSMKPTPSNTSTSSNGPTSTKFKVNQKLQVCKEQYKLEQTS
ncbi:hypothetical protein QTG54_010113 [Skeletonema marinoi]|uniref:Uncharacterized protein n=1 Tax=Skeletonema marinoi TaxID=267567 RepID=A0AAD8Y5N9_9STRA|nr:hypothetical protein QTG54_010113 [Skeletonema marinoi]